MLLLKAILAMSRISFVFELYLARRFIAKAISSLVLFVRYIRKPTQRHWEAIKDILCYLQRTLDMGLFYSRVLSFNLIGFADVGYLSNPRGDRSQTRYIFTYNSIAMS